jgi:hypothetical protein
MFIALLWLASVTGMGLSLLPDLSWARGVAALASLLFIATLIRNLVRDTPRATDLPDLSPIAAPRLGFWAMTALITLSILALLFIGLMVSPGASLLSAAALIALGVAIAWRSNLRRPVVLIGLAAGTIVGLGIRYLERGQLAWAIMNAVAIPPVFVGGVLLMDRSGLGQIRLLAGQYRLSLQGLAWGCFLAVPAAILNFVGNVQGGDTWVRHWWQPVAAVDPAIAEELWARLFLTTFIYMLLRPRSNDHPSRALYTALLLGSLTHALAHAGINPVGLVIGSLLFEVPTGLLFIKRDLEHAIGYHFLVDYLRFMAALLALT